MDKGIQDREHNPVERSRRWRGLTARQWVVLATLGGLLLAVVAALILVLRSGMVDPRRLAPAAPALEPGSASLPHPGVVISSSLSVYWPPQPQLLAPPDAPGNRLWWDMRYAYRREVLLDEVAQRAPAGTTVEVLWDGDAAVSAGRARADGSDVRVVYWDGQWWHEQARAIRSSADGPGWRISFELVGGGEESGRYHLYYGVPSAAEVGPAAELGPVPEAEGGPAPHALLVALANEESVEWGPIVLWTANSVAPQVLVSPDGRVVFEHPAGGLRHDTRVRLRIVPLSERSGLGPLPEYEFHADPPPGVTEEGQLARWNPPVRVSINWAGLPGDGPSRTWVRFRYDETAAMWSPVPIEVDAETGILRFTTDQP
jgi:hypothetical protein